MYRKILSFIAVLVLWMMASYAQVTVEATIDSLGILLGQQTCIHLEVTCDANQQVVMPTLHDSLPSTMIDAGPYSFVRDSLSCDIEILGDVKTDTIKINNDKRLSLKQDYTITSFNPGLYQIAGFEVLVDGVSYNTDDLALKVVIYDEVLPKDNKVDDEYTFSIFGIKDIRRAPIQFKEIIPLLIGIGILLVLTLLFLYLLKHYRTNSPILQRITLEPILPAHIKAQNALGAIRDEQGWTKEDSKAYYTGLTDALRQYIKNRFAVDATEMTTAQMLDHLTNIANAEQYEEIRELLNTADFVKFAKFHPLQNEKMVHFDVVNNYVEATKKEQDESEEPQIEYVVVKKGLSHTAKSIMLGTLILLCIVAVAVLIWMITFGVNLFI